MECIYVYESFFSEEAKLMGILYSENIRGGQNFSFEFDSDWLRHSSKKYIIDPDLEYVTGRQYLYGKPLFGIFADTSPDRWGRTLIDRRERLYADKESRKPKKLNESDYMLGVYDETRMGAVRYSLVPGGTFLSDDPDVAAPPWTTLRSLEEASRNFESEEGTLREKWLNQLIKPGSSLGGARPKANVLAPDNSLWIAKFPSRHDGYNVGAWEKTAYDLASMCDINTAPCRLENFSKFGSTFLVKRFDRDGNRRIHFASAMTLLGKTDGRNSSGDSSYLEIADFISANGGNPSADLAELFRRIVFNMAITNSDDHLRNHGFILTPRGWVLSPVYDINPVPYGDSLSLTVDGDSAQISEENIVKAAPYYGLSEKDAMSTVAKIKKTVGDNWEKVAAQNGLTRDSREYMRPAFYFCK